jgi:large subunit ribosomal protein L9
MKVIFIKDLKGQGRKGEIVEVKDGYGMNFLIQKGYAVIASENNIKKLENDNNQKQLKEQENINECQKVKEKLEKLNLKFKVKTGEKDHVFGSVSSKQIITELKKNGIDIDKKMINMKETLACLGFHNIEIYLHKKVLAILKVELIKE